MRILTATNLPLLVRNRQRISYHHEVKTLLLGGLTLQAVGDKLGLSRERVRQIAERDGFWQEERIKRIRASAERRYAAPHLRLHNRLLTAFVEAARVQGIHQIELVTFQLIKYKAKTIFVGKSSVSRLGYTIFWRPQPKADVYAFALADGRWLIVPLYGLPNGQARFALRKTWPNKGAHRSKDYRQWLERWDLIED